MILSGHEIEAQLGGNIVIDPFDPSRLNPNSYNLTLHDELIVYEEVVLDMRKPNGIGGSRSRPKAWCSAPINSILPAPWSEPRRTISCR